MDVKVILKGTMIKKSQQKRRTSRCNYKERQFVLDTQSLSYLQQRPGKKPTLKGCIQLSAIRCAEIVCSSIPLPCTNKYPFQVFHDNLHLYIFAPDSSVRQIWVRALKEEIKHNDLVVKYHPNFWMDGRWQCCHQTGKLAAGCKEYSPEPNEMLVVAVEDYTPQGHTDLPLQMDQEYTMIESSHPDWWTIQDNLGNKGFVPCTYIAEKYSRNFDRFEWYNKDITRGREGGFMVRDSRHAGFYAMSVFAEAPGSNGLKNPRVKHYQIQEIEVEGEKMFYLAEKHHFNNIPRLINYHKLNSAGLITRLRRPVSQNRILTDNRFNLNKAQWEVDPGELVLGGPLGSGQFGMVLEARWREKKVAVKMARGEAMSEEDFIEEIEILTKLSHCKLVQLYGVCTQRRPPCLVMELLENGCLSDYLRARKGCLSPAILLGMCLDVNEAMAYLESSKFIHRDLAARNCLVSRNNQVKVSDFGMARWSAPEVIKYSEFSSKSDIWSFVYNEGRMPYGHRTNTQVMESLSTGLRLLQPCLTPNLVYLLMERCWKEKPDDRPSFAVLLHDLASLSELKK
ncbi:hypothetical protein NHX12_011448 [Muraenolepis orangiensis]|uniref:Tyrosine-protein kinase n=1 Tax=Muraenolepis orangiensis TaxID=630683 RepID=A0A9Q0DHX1_9TELE|nr:hypothetical protein NHX12_011448 [Muraenolepis orangiensis]